MMINYLDLFNKNTKAVIVPHLFGNIAEIDKIKNLFVKKKNISNRRLCRGFWFVISKKNI